MQVTPTLIGYFPKKRLPTPERLSGTAAEEVCSISECLAPGPPDWIEHWIHNDWGYFNSVADALSVVPGDGSEYQILALALLPQRFVNGDSAAMEIQAPQVEALPDSFVPLGFDVASKSESVTFECSPLSCNLMAAEIQVNRYCLLDDLEQALQAASRFSLEQPEPGAYYVIQVHMLGTDQARNVLPASVT